MKYVLKELGIHEHDVVPEPLEPCGRPEPREQLTIVITTSPIVSNPSTRLLQEVVASFRLTTLGATQDAEAIEGGEA